MNALNIQNIDRELKNGTNIPIIGFENRNFTAKKNNQKICYGF